MSTLSPPRRLALALGVGSVLVCAAAWGASGGLDGAGAVASGPGDGGTTPASPAASDPGPSDPAATGPAVPPLVAAGPPVLPEPSALPVVDRTAPYTRLAESQVEETGLREGLPAWRSQVPSVRELTYRSTVDRTPQRTLLVPPTAAGPVPLLVVLHSWSGSYAQDIGIPYARFAQQRGWAMIQPDFRGPGVRPAAGGSGRAVQDVVDAIDLAVRETSVDATRVYVVGFSGGGHMALLLAGQHPDRVAGVATFGAVTDLVDWYAFTGGLQPDPARRAQLEAVCGGNPLLPGPARDSCLARSPVTTLPALAAAGVPVFLAAGLSDTRVPPTQTLRAYDALTPGRAFTAEQLARVRRGVLPDDLGGVGVPTGFEGPDPRVLWARQSGPVTGVLFDGRHALVYNPGLAWIVGLDAVGAPEPAVELMAQPG